MCRFSVQLDGAGQFLHGRCSFLQVAGLLLGALRQIAVSGCDLGGSCRNAVAGLTHLAHQTYQCSLHGAHGRDNAAFCRAAGVDVHSQIAACNAIGNACNVDWLASQLAGQTACQKVANGNAHNQPTQGQRDEQHPDVAINSLCLIVEMARVCHLEFNNLAEQVVGFVCSLLHRRGDVIRRLP